MKESAEGDKGRRGVHEDHSFKSQHYSAMIIIKSFEIKYGNGNRG